MGRINLGRLLLMGLITGVIVDVVEGIMNGWLLAGAWTAALAVLGQPPFGIGNVIVFNLWGLVEGFAAAWIYVGFRPRFGPGPVTALYAALTTWVLGYLLPYVGLAQSGMPAGLMIEVGLVGLVEIVVATVVGMHAYREGPARMGT